MKSYHADVKRVKTKRRTKSVRSYELLRQEEMEMQCEHFFMSLDCEDMRDDSHEKGLSYVTDSEVEKEKDEALKSDMGMEKTQTLDISLLNTATNKVGALGVVSYTLESVVELPYNKGLIEPLGIKLGQLLTMYGDEKSWSSTWDVWGNDSYTPPRSECHNILVYGHSYYDLEIEHMGGIFSNLLTPHFHFYMLLRLMVGLVNTFAVIKFFISSCSVFSLDLCKSSSKGTWYSFEFRKCLRYGHWNLDMLIIMLFKLGRIGMIIFEWKLLKGAKLKQRACFCFDVNVLSLRYIEGFACWVRAWNCCPLFAMSLEHSSYLLDGVLGELKLREPVNLSMGGSSSLVRLVALRKEPKAGWYMRGRTIIRCVQLGHKACSHGMSVYLDTIQAYNSNDASMAITQDFQKHVHNVATLKMPRDFMMIFDPGKEEHLYNPLSCSEMKPSDTKACGVIRERNFIIIYDPGGHDRNQQVAGRNQAREWVDDIVVLSIMGWLWVLDNRNLRANSLKKGSLQHE